MPVAKEFTNQRVIDPGRALTVRYRYSGCPLPVLQELAQFIQYHFTFVYIAGDLYRFKILFI